MQVAIHLVHTACEIHILCMCTAHIYASHTICYKFRSQTHKILNNALTFDVSFIKFNPNLMMLSERQL